MKSEKVLYIVLTTAIIAVFCESMAMYAIDHLNVAFQSIILVTLTVSVLTMSSIAVNYYIFSRKLHRNFAISSDQLFLRGIVAVRMIASYLAMVVVLAVAFVDTIMPAGQISTNLSMVAITAFSVISFMLAIFSLSKFFNEVREI